MSKVYIGVSPTLRFCIVIPTNAEGIVNVRLFNNFGPCGEIF